MLYEEKIRKHPPRKKRSELFYSGRDCRAFDYMGAHPSCRMVNRVICSVFMHRRPKKVSVMGEFNDWNRDADYMTRDEQGIWEKFIPNIPEYAAYKYSVWASRDVFDKSDRTASISRPVRATPPRRMTSTATNGATPRGWTGVKSTCRIPIRSTSTNATSARGRCTRTATSTPTASWRTSLCRMSRKWATPTSSLCR